jgi:hypothetical protein
MKRTITGRAAAGSMTLGELRQFMASIDSLPDEALVKVRTKFRRHMRAITVEEEDVGFGDYVRAVGAPDEEAKAGRADRGRAGAGGAEKARA